MTTVDPQTLAALQQAARFVLEYASDIDVNADRAATHVRAEHPNAAPEAITHAHQESDQLRKALDEVLDALAAAGINA